MEKRMEEERARVSAEYRRVLKNSVRFEKKIRNRWREKVREKNRRIVELEERIARLEKRLSRARERIQEAIVDRETKERKMVALMIGDLGMYDVKEPEMIRMNEEISALSDDELDRMLASRLGLKEPVNGQELEEALALVSKPERASADGPGGFTGAPDMSHEPRPEEREGKQ